MVSDLGILGSEVGHISIGNKGLPGLRDRGAEKHRACRENIRFDWGVDSCTFDNLSYRSKTIDFKDIDTKKYIREKILLTTYMTINREVAD